MPRQLNPIQKIWALFIMELALMLALVIILQRFQTSVANGVQVIEWNNSPLAALRDTIQSQTPETGAPLRDGAVKLLNMTKQANDLLPAMSVQTDRVVDMVCIALVICSCWLGHAVYEVHCLRHLPEKAASKAV